MSKISIKLADVSNLKAKVSNNITTVNENGTTIQEVLDSITVSNGLIDTRSTNQLDISGEDLQTEALSNFDIKEILDL